jgi:hypothetical protein
LLRARRWSSGACRGHRSAEGRAVGRGPCRRGAIHVDDGVD